MKLKVSFPEGAYSTNKVDIKKVFDLLDYKYKSGIERNGQLNCLWQRLPEKQSIKGFFNGSGKECYFIIECNEDEREIFEAFASFKARVSLYNEDTIDIGQLVEKAKEKVNSWWTPQLQLKEEPNYFFMKRKEKEAIDYQWFVQRELERLKGNI